MSKNHTRSRKVVNTALVSTVIAVSASSVLLSNAHADTFVFEATRDFPVIDAGEIPYYSESPGRASLAINAAIEDYRNKFARATLRYEGESDFYDITLTGLAELDGEAQYRVLVNDVLVGTATNPEVETDYTPIRHTFEDIVVPNGATVAVESLANTNGKIPEGDGTAYARGRWTSLELDNGDAGTSAQDDVDLVLSASMNRNTVGVGDVFTVSVDISNTEGSAVATSPELALTRPRAEVALASETTLPCQEVDNDIICELSEIAAGDTTRISVSLLALAASPTALLRASITADQVDINPDDNTVILPLSINDTEEEVDAPDPTDGSNGNSGEEQLTEQPTEAAGDVDVAVPASSRSGGGALSLWALLILALTRSGRNPEYAA